MLDIHQCNDEPRSLSKVIEQSPAGLEQVLGDRHSRSCLLLDLSQPYPSIPHQSPGLHGSSYDFSVPTRHMGRLPVIWSQLLPVGSQPGASESDLEYQDWVWVPQEPGSQGPTFFA